VNFAQGRGVDDVFFEEGELAVWNGEIVLGGVVDGHGRANVPNKLAPPLLQCDDSQYGEVGKEEVV